MENALSLQRQFTQLVSTTTRAPEASLGTVSAPGPWTSPPSGFETTQLYSRTGFLNSRAEFYNARTGFFKTHY